MLCELYEGLDPEEKIAKLPLNYTLKTYLDEVYGMKFTGKKYIVQNIQKKSVSFTVQCMGNLLALAVSLMVVSHVRLKIS